MTTAAVGVYEDDGGGIDWASLLTPEALLAIGTTLSDTYRRLGPP
jgi:hypothetical protein